jgi:hypothetical protein
MTESKKNKVEVEEVDRQIRLAYLHYELAAKFSVHNFIFLSISLTLLLAGVFFSLLPLAEVSLSARKITGLVSLVPSMFGIFLCFAWFTSHRRNQRVLNSLYSATIDRQKRVGFGDEPFLFTTREVYFSTHQFSSFPWGTWNLLIALSAYFQLLVFSVGVVRWATSG